MNCNQANSSPVFVTFETDPHSFVAAGPANGPVRVLRSPRKTLDFSVIRVAILFLIAFASLAHGGQQQIPCKYFPLLEKTSVASAGGSFTLKIRNDPAQFQQGQQEEYEKKCPLAFDTPAPWLTVVDRTPLDVQGYSIVTLRAEPNDIPAERTATLTIGTSRTVYRGKLPHPANTAVLIKQSAMAASPVITAVVNNASYGPIISPGSLISIFGTNLTSATATLVYPFPTNFNGTTVTIDGMISPLLYASPSQINVQVPMTVPYGSQSVGVFEDNGAGDAYIVTVIQAAPGIYTLSDGVSAIAQHSDYSLVTAAHPAKAGELITFYGTGIGVVYPSLVTGQAAGGGPNLSYAQFGYYAEIGGVAVPVEFCGLAPGFVGLMQVNVRVPNDVPSGSVTFTLFINKAESRETRFFATGPGPTAPTINSFKFNPSTISEGQPTTLSWSVSNATSVSINYGFGTQPANGQIVLGGSSGIPVYVGSTVYTLTAQNCVNGSCPQTIATATLTVGSSAGPVINSFTVSPSSISAGQSATLSWSVSNASSVSIDNNIGSVANSGVESVAPNSTTTYTITAVNSAGLSVSQSVTLTVTSSQNVTLVFTNYLINGAAISVNGTPVGTVGAGQTQHVTLPSQPTMNVTFDVISTQTAEGMAIGDPISGYFDPLTNPTGTLNFTISNSFPSTDTYYFAPLITNISGTTLEMAVNYGLQAQNECNCTVPSGAGAITIGYYLYYPNSNVAAFADGSNYSGPAQYFNGTQLASIVQANSGIANLTFNVAP
jgi:uncharacterized protein (TIGR03437 family)